MRRVTDAASLRIGGVWAAKAPNLDRVRPSAGARCGKAARRDLRGGAGVTRSPTATVPWRRADGLVVEPQAVVRADGGDQRGTSQDDCCWLSKPCFVGDCEHGWLIDNTYRVPRKHRITLLRAINSGWDLHVKLLRQPGESSIATKKNTMILIAVGMKTGREPSTDTTGTAPTGIPPNRIQLISRNTKLNRAH